MKTVMRCVVTEAACPFALCDRRGLHEHELCETCGAARHGNLRCAACRRFHGFVLPEAVERRLLERTTN